jgi:hypothetical protein
MRIVRTPEGSVRLDPTGKANGRGAYLCVNPDCIARAAKKNTLERLLKAPVPKAIYDDLLHEARRLAGDDTSPGAAGPL